MSGFNIVELPVLTDATGKPVGMIGSDGKEVFFPTFSSDLGSLVKPDGSLLSGGGAGYSLPVATATVLGGVKAGTGVSIAGDGTLSASGGAAAITGTATADEALAARNLIYIKANGNCARADSTAEGKEAVAFVLAAVASGAAATFSMIGSLIPGFTGLTPGAPYYLGTAGAIVNLAGAPTTAGNVLMKVGTAISTTTLLFAPEAPITL